MPTPPTTGDPRVDVALQATGFRWHIDPDDPVANVKSHLQHRRDEGLNKQALRRYQNMYKAGSTPPPICRTQDGVLVYGNHRVGAAEMAGWEKIPAIVIEVDAQGGDEHLENQLLSIAYAENAPHGVPYSPADRMLAAQHLVSLGYTNRSIQAELGLSSSQVSGVKREHEAQVRLDSLGIPTSGMTRGMLQTLAGPDARALNNDPFKELVALAKGAALTSTEVNALAKDAKAAGSDADALVLLNDRRDGLKERIAQVTTGGAPQRPGPVGRLRGALAGTLRLCDGMSPEVYRDQANTVLDTIDMLDHAITCLQAIRAVQVAPEPEE